MSSSVSQQVSGESYYAACIVSMPKDQKSMPSPEGTVETGGMAQMLGIPSGNQQRDHHDGCRHLCMGGTSMPDSRPDNRRDKRKQTEKILDQQA